MNISVIKRLAAPCVLGAAGSAVALVTADKAISNAKGSHLPLELSAVLGGSTLTALGLSLSKSPVKIHSIGGLGLIGLGIGTAGMGVEHLTGLEE